MINLFYTPFCGFSGESDGKESACNAGDASSIPGSGRYPREGNCNPLQYSCLEKEESSCLSQREAVRVPFI